MSHRRALYPSEAMFAANRSTVAYSVFGTGTLDRTALAIAFEALLRAYPVLAAKLVADGPGWLLEPAAGRPALRDSAVTDIPPGGFHVVEADAVCALDVAQGRGEFRLTLLTHHSIADATASLRYLQRFCELYTETVEAGTPGQVIPHPLPESLEEVLGRRGFDLSAAATALAAPARADSASTRAPDVRPGRTRLSAAQTTALFAIARRERLTVHGVVCAAVLLAARELAPSSEPVSFGVVSSVDLRTRTSPPITAEAGTVIQGFDTAVVMVARDDDPIRLGRAVLDSLAANLANRTVHETFLRKHEVRPRGVVNPLMVTNWGRIPALRFPVGVRAHDFRAAARGLRMERAHTAPPSFFVTTFEGWLSVDHPLWVIDGSDPTRAWAAALERAFRRIADRDGHPLRARRGPG